MNNRMKAKVGEYEYHPCGNLFRIYVCDYWDGITKTCSPVYTEPFFDTEEEARKRVYQLNGWKYRPRHESA